MSEENKINRTPPTQSLQKEHPSKPEHEKPNKKSPPVQEATDTITISDKAREKARE